MAPVCQCSKLAAGDEHHRIIPVGSLVGGNEVRRRRILRGRWRVGNASGTRPAARIALVLAGIGDRRVALQALPGDALDESMQLLISLKTSLG